MAISRRKFVELTVIFTGTALAGAGAALSSACSSDEETADPPTPGSKDAATADSGGPADAAGADAAKDSAPTAVECRSTITQNHGHRITIPLTDLDSSSPKTYSIIGAADHDHQVTFEPSDLAQLKSKLSVKKTSTNGGTTHDHDVTVLCT